MLVPLVTTGWIEVIVYITTLCMYVYDPMTLPCRILALIGGLTWLYLHDAKRARWPFLICAYFGYIQRIFAQFETLQLFTLPDWCNIVILVLGLGIVTVILPLSKLPEPLGNIPVVTFRHHFVGIVDTKWFGDEHMNSKYVSELIPRYAHAESQDDASKPTKEHMDIVVQFYFPLTNSNDPTIAKAISTYRKCAARQYIHNTQARAVAAFASLPSVTVRSLPAFKPIQSVVDLDILAQYDPESFKTLSDAFRKHSKLPVVAFSHGLGGAPELYQVQAAMLAAEGYCVVCLTHTDSSASLCLTYEETMRAYTTVHTETKVQHEYLETKKKSESHTEETITWRSTLQFRRIAPQETEAKLDREIRHVQLCRRAREVEFVINVLELLEKCAWDPNQAIDDYVAPTYGFYSTKPSMHLKDLVPSLVKWNTLAPIPSFCRLDLNRLGLCGHSFGGATMLTLCTFDPRIKSAFLLDPWLYPIADKVRIPSDEVDTSTTTLETSTSELSILQPNNPKPRKLPLCIVVSERWVAWKEHQDALVEVAKFHNKHQPLSKFLVMHGTSHSNFSDVPFWFPWLAYFTRNVGRANAYKCWYELQKLQGKFFAQFLRENESQVKTTYFDGLNQASFGILV